jgi:hypothetical protein
MDAMPAIASAGGSDRRDAFSSRAIHERVTDPIATDETRIDRWLCAVRLMKGHPLADPVVRRWPLHRG